MSLDDQLYQIWLLQLQTWAADGRLLSAGLEALRLKPGRQSRQLNRIANRLANGDTRDLPPIEVLSGSAMAGAMGAYAGATGTIYLNKHWLNKASTTAAQAVLMEEFGHHLDQVLSEEDTEGDEGEVQTAWSSGKPPSSVQGASRGDAPPRRKRWIRPARNATPL